MGQKELDLILTKRKKWLNGEEGGACAYLCDANLHGASCTGIGMPKYLVIFKKWSDGDTTPIKHYKSEEDTVQKADCSEQVIDLKTRQKYASPVWFDIKRNRRMRED